MKKFRKCRLNNIIVLNNDIDHLESLRACVPESYDQSVYFELENFIKNRIHLIVDELNQIVKEISE